MTALPWGAPLTYEDLQQMPDDGHRYELIDGTLLVSPAPRTKHQRVVLRVAMALSAAVGPDLEVFPAPTDFIVSDTTVLEPDVLVAERRNVSERAVEGAAVLVVEVISPSSRMVDWHTKRARYAQAGVPAYWIVDPDVPSVTAFRLEGGEYVEQGRAEGDQPLVLDVPKTSLSVTIVPADLVR